MIGRLAYTLHLVNVGWVVFDDAAVWMNIYWTALTALDPLAAMLLLYRPPVGLALGAVIILRDVRDQQLCAVRVWIGVESGIPLRARQLPVIF